MGDVSTSKHRRRRVRRLQDYDYSWAGAYFVTMCTHNRERLFGKVAASEMYLNTFGGIVQSAWSSLPECYPTILLDEFIVMPDHVHGIIVITEDGEKKHPAEAIYEFPRRMSRLQRREMLLPKIIGRFKQNSAKQINLLRNSPGVAVWQRNYYEHIIRNAESARRIREYIASNPLKWTIKGENRVRLAGKVSGHNFRQPETGIVGM